MTEELTDSAATEGNTEASETQEVTATSATASAGEVTTDGDAVETTDAEKAEAAKNHEIAEARRKKNEAKQEAANERARAEEAERKLAEREAAALPQGRPNRDDFDTEEGYEDAVTDYRIRVNAAENATKVADKDKKDKVASDRRKYGVGYEGAIERLDNFDEIAGDLDAMKLKATFTNQIMASDKAHDIVYHLGKNADEAKRIASLSDLEQAKELGKLEAKLEVSIPKNNITTAQDPGADLAGGGTNTSGGKRKETAREFADRRNSEEEAKWANGG
ncbi:MAG: hypothetical protein KAS32_24995 [Candidatus Peribacteraceae bacterium]|nr:hypothetical protein [Candidatus Peribacteraceae bacterium]